MKTGRNERCPCGSGRKYKHCCEGKKTWYKNSTLAGILLILFLLGAGALAWSELSHEGSSTQTEGLVWDPEHGHYH